MKSPRDESPLTTPPAPHPGATTFVVPARVLFLGEALASVARATRIAMARRVRPSTQAFATLEDASRHLGLIEQALTHLNARLEGLMTDVICNEPAGMAQAGRAAGRLEQVLAALVEGYLQAKAAPVDVDADADAAEARALILRTYRHHIREICHWLDEMVQAIANPEAALKQRGIALAPEVQLAVTLNLTSPPEMARLGALAKRLRPPPETDSELSSFYVPPEPRQPAIIAPLGTLAFSLGFTRAALERGRG